MIRLSRGPLALVLLVAFWGGVGLEAQPLDNGPIRIQMVPQVMEPDHTVSWSQSLQSETVPGRPVTMTIDANHMAIRVTVTPFVRPDGYLLVVQGNVRQSSPQGVRRSSSVQSLQVKPRDPLVFFPLGRAAPDSREMEIVITVESAGD